MIVPVAETENLEKPVRIRMTNHVEGHLALPIVNTECNMMLNCTTFKCKKHNLLKAVLKERSISHQMKIVSIYESECSPWRCLGKTIERTEMPGSYNKLTSIADISSQILAIYIEMTLGVTVDPDRLPRIEVTDDMVRMYKQKLQSEQLKSKICYRSVKRGNFIEYNKNLEVEPDVFLHRCEEHNCYTIGPTTLLLGKLDLYPTIFNQHLIWKMCDQDRMFNDFSIFNYGTRLFKVLNSLQAVMGEDFFTICATVEPLLKGNILARDDDLGFKTLKEQCEKKILEFENNEVGSINYHNKKLPNGSLLREIIDLANEIGQNCPLIGFELCGLVKSFGHPVVDDEEGLDSLRDRACKDADIDENYAKEIAGTVKQLFIKNYYLKHNHYPKFQTWSNKISRMVAQNKWDSSMDNLSPHEFNKIKFEKIFDYDYSPDTFQLIKDTAQAPDFDYWSSQYDACGFWYQHGQEVYIHPVSFVQRRVIMRYMQGSDKEIEKVIQDMDNGIYNLSRDGIIMLCLKEREMKRIGRMFCKQTYIRRLAQTSMEKNINEKVFRYFPEQTMSQSELELSKRHASLMKINYELAQIINLDLKKWNLCFRFMLVVFIGAFLDQLFGFRGLYGNCHLFFTACFFLTNNRLCPPILGLDGKPVPGKFCHVNHQGGCEGMHQKLWTLITIGIIQNTAKSCGLLVHIMGQGDNIVVIIMFKPTQIANQNQLRDEFLEKLRDNLAKVNLELKMEETWYSKQVLEYGKRIWYKNRETTNLTKKARIIPFVNDGFNAHLTNLDTIATGTEALAKGDYNPMRAYVVYIAEMLTYMDRIGMIDLHPTKRMENLCTFFIPQCFGGLNISSFFNHMMRGINDQVTMWLYIIRYLKSNHFIVYDHVIRRLTTSSSGQVNYAALLEDPFCLNPPTPPSISGKVRSLVKEYIREVATNPELAQLHAIRNEEAEFDIIQDLINMKPFIPELASELFSLSLVGYLNKLTNRFTSISTLNRVTQEQNGTMNFIDETNENNLRVVEHFKKRFTPKSKDYLDELLDTILCDTELASHLRVLHWSLEFEHETKPFFLHQFKIQDYDLVLKDDVMYTIIVSLSEELANSRNAYHLGEGNYTPYLGSVTQQKTISPHLKMVSDNPMIHYIEKLYLYYTWMTLYKCLSVANYLLKLIQEKLPLLPEELINSNIQEWAPRITGGNPAHRLHSIYSKVGCFINYLFTPTSHISYSTNHLKDLSPKGEDFNIQFQQIFIGFQARIILHTRFFESRPRTMACTVDCRTCFKDVTDYKVELPTQNYFNHAIVADLPLVYDLEERHEEHNWKIVRKQLGRYLGVLGGHSYDHDSLADKTYSYLRKVDYIAEFRSIKFIDYIVGMILQSAALIKTMFDDTDYCYLGTPRKGFFTLANLLLTSDRMGEFVRWGNYPAEHHSSMINVEGASVLIFNIIKQYISKNKYWILRSLFEERYEDETIAQIYHKMLFYCVSMKKWNKLTLLKNKYRLLQQTGVNRGFFMHYMSIQHEVVGRLSPDSAFTINNPIIRMQARRSGSFGPYVPKWHYSPESVVTVETYDVGRYYDMMTINRTGVTLSIKNIHHICRQYISISSAMSKLVGLFVPFGLLEIKPKFIYSLCEGSGSILLMLSHVYKDSLLMFNTLNSDKVDVKHHPGIVEPTAVMAHKCPVESNIVNVFKLTLGATNVLTQEFINKIVENLNTFEGSILTLDPESPHGGSNMEFLELYYEVYNGYFDNTAFMLSKMFYEKYLNGTDVFDRIDEKIDLYYVYKSPASHPSNAEFYILISKNQRIKEKIRLFQNESEKCKNYFRRGTLLTSGNAKCFVDFCMLHRKVFNPNSCLMAQNLGVTFGVSACSSICIRLLKKLLNSALKCITELKQMAQTRAKHYLLKYNALLINLKQLLNLIVVEYLVLKKRTILEQALELGRLVDSMDKWSYYIENDWETVQMIEEPNRNLVYDKSLFKGLRGKCTCRSKYSLRDFENSLSEAEDDQENKNFLLIERLVNHFSNN